MQEWLQDKLDGITTEFQEGASYGTVFEATYLAYLECLVASKYGVKAASKVWSEWYKVCEAATPTGSPVQCLSNVVSDREPLLDALRQLRNSFSGPARKRFKLPARTRTPNEDIGLFDILGED